MLLAAIIIGLLVYLAIAAVILSSACSLVRVKPPDFFFAMIICLMVGMAVFMIQLAAGVAGTLGAGVPLSSLQTMKDYLHLLQRGALFGTLSTPFVSAGIYTVVLQDCSYLRALLIWLMQIVVVVLILLGIWVVCASLGLTGHR